eukprot:s2740_g12.t1
MPMFHKHAATPLLGMHLSVARLNRLRQKPGNLREDGRRCSQASSSQASALRQNIQSKGENAYYYAHNRKFEVPPEARVISGPGLVTGGPPVKLEVEAGQSEQSSERQVHALRNFSWTDDGTKVKVYVQLPPDVLRDVSQVTCDFAPRKLHIQVTPTSGAVCVCKVEPLYGDIVPEASSFRANVEKAKVSVAMQKKNGSQTWYDLKKT